MEEVAVHAMGHDFDSGQERVEGDKRNKEYI